MAKLIFEETWSDGNWTSRGFQSGGNGYYLEHDELLDRNVMYNQWSNSSSDPMPDEVGNGLMKRVDNNIINNGCTLYALFKSHNYISVYGAAGRGRSHIGPKLNVSVYSAGNANGEIAFDHQLNKNYFGAGLSPTESLSPPVYGYSNPGINLTKGESWTQSQWQIQSDRSGAEYTWADWGPNGSHRDEMVDDQWYELALYIKTNDGAGINQSIHFYFREYGTSTWKIAFAYDNVPVINVSSNDSSVGWGTYLHQQAIGLSDDIRFYSGGLWFYEGNAVIDGLLGNPPNNTVPIEPPVTPPVSGGAPNIEGLTAVPMGTSASIVWTTDIPANAVVDYGDTEARGTMARDDNMVVNHSVGLDGLTEGTTYYYRVSSKCADGQITLIEENNTFVASTPITPPIEPPTPIGYNVILDAEPVEGAGVIFREGKWVAIDLESEVIKIIQDRTKLKVS